MNQTIRMSSEIRNLRQVITTQVQIVKESLADNSISSEEKNIINGVQKRINNIFDNCLDLSKFRPDIHNLISELHDAILQNKSHIDSLLLAPSEKKTKVLLIDQFALEIQEGLEKVQIVLAADSNQIFERIFKARYIPLTVAVALSVMFLIFALLMGYSLKRRINKPIQNLIQSTRQLAEGKLGTRAIVYDEDELGLLAHAFNIMADNLEQTTVSRSYVESILESMFNCVLVVDKNGTILTVNRLTVKTFGYTKNELVGLSMYDILHDDVSILNQNTNLETEAFTKSGYKFPVQVAVSILENRQGMSSNLRVCVIKDITESKKLENEIKDSNLALNAANQELEAFSYSVSHDLRAPLRIIDGFSQALIEDAGNHLNDEAKSHISRIRAGVQRMGDLIDAVLNLSRLTRTNMSITSVDLTTMAKSITADLRVIEPSHRVEVLIHEGMTAMADKVLIKITLENLIGNAWKYTSKKELAKIEFGELKKNDETVYFVKDNGAGFDMAYANKLFTPFQRLHPQNEFSGTGIGLASVKRIIHRHGGKIWVESEVEKGTVFYFTLGKPA